ncbi:Cof-type HAD-IIB family hydrolase [Acetivibrio cellulolyticus]|uniref:Cof-type HAD-IIB family hydrolase n=1 Tax=Acetivibrio cellulolyticus TaxID=35830 RepID=UPI0001E2C703|nr:Cof-type HAD-IIB family hydrolase [Acetivibrio cellulolyticus]
MYKMICLDVDGTLIDSQLKIPESNRKMIKQIADEGVPVVLASARPAVGMGGLVEELGIHQNPLVAFGGSYITKGNEVLFQKKISYECAINIYLTASTVGCDHITVFSGDRWAVRAKDSITEFEMGLLGIEPEFVGNLDNVLKYEFSKGVDKFLIAGEHSHLVTLKEKLDALDAHIETVFSKPHYLEIHPEGVSKADAISIVAESLGISREEVVACGDGFNDLPMLEWAGVGVAMGNAPLEVRKKANFITLSNDECGVAHVIEQLFIKSN